MSWIVGRLVVIGAVIGVHALFRLAGWTPKPDPDRARKRRDESDANPPVLHDVDGVTVRASIVDAQNLMLLEVYALVPGGARFRDVSGEQLAADELLPAPVREQLRDVMPHASFHSDGRRIWVRDTTLMGRDFDAALFIVAALARRGVNALQALRELPGAVYDPPRGPWEARTPPRVHLPGDDVTFELRARDGGGARTIAWTEIGTEPRVSLPPPLVREDARLVYAFDAVETDATKLLAAAEMLRFAAASARAGRYG
jgi:hypothetical protein